MDGLNADIAEVRQMGQRGYEEAEAAFSFFRFLGRVSPWLPRKIFPFRVLLSPFPMPLAPLVCLVRTGCGIHVVERHYRETPWTLQARGGVEPDP